MLSRHKTGVAMRESFPISELIAGIRTVVGEPEAPLHLHKPCFGKSANVYVKECVDTGWVSSVGKFVDQFESELSKLTGARRVTATVNGTSALHVALLVSGVAPHTEVLCPSLTFVATANAIRYCDATPHFVEVEASSLGVDAGRLREYLQQVAVRKNGKCTNKNTGRQISALVAMHAFGHPFDVDAVAQVCAEFGIPLVEDAAESIGSWYHRKHTGTMGSVGILSFNGNKTVTTGGGGAVLTNSDELADNAKHLTTTGKVPHPYRILHDVTAYNYRLPNINAALGISQLEDLEEILQYKRGLAARYVDQFASCTAFTILQEPEGCKSNYWLNALVLADAFVVDQDEIMRQLHDAGILVRTVWEPMHTLPMFRDCPSANLDLTERLVKRIINLPSSPVLQD